MRKDTILELIIKLIFIAVLVFVFTKLTPVVMTWVFNYIANIASTMWFSILICSVFSLFSRTLYQIRIYDPIFLNIFALSYQIYYNILWKGRLVCRPFQFPGWFIQPFLSCHPEVLSLFSSHLLSLCNHQESSRTFESFYQTVCLS